MTPKAEAEAEAQAAALAERLKDAHARVRRLDADAGTRARVARRLLALTDASKVDVGRAALRLDALLGDLDAGRLPTD